MLTLLIRVGRQCQHFLLGPVDKEKDEMEYVARGRESFQSVQKLEKIGRILFNTIRLHYNRQLLL